MLFELKTSAFDSVLIIADIIIIHIDYHIIIDHN